MSVQAQSWVIKNSKHKGSALLVMLMIANHAHADGSNAFPSVQTLAAECRMSERQIIRLIAELEKSGELLIEKSRGRIAHTYAINMRTNPDNLSSLNPDKLSRSTLTNPKLNPDISGMPTLTNSPFPIYKEEPKEEKREEKRQRDAETAPAPPPVGENENPETASPSPPSLIQNEDAVAAAAAPLRPRPLSVDEAAARLEQAAPDFVPESGAEIIYRSVFGGINLKGEQISALQKIPFLDRAVFRQTCETWRTDGYRASSVGSLIDRYKNDLKKNGVSLYTAGGGFLPRTPPPSGFLSDRWKNNQ
ncbi:MAG TPA: helix-turn-helix domain-containing protein [Pyrinomonadaceae bacterium]|nr:helix-turn-helix domain-containing protein [Pyrinomonadaceae bacterium]